MNEEQQWQALVSRDASMDKRFVYGVLTTGIYCRPSCASRKPLRKNVRFYADATEAEQDGLRPCKRCRPDADCPDEVMKNRIHNLCRYIQAHAADKLTLASLGAKAHMSPEHLQRRFKDVVGVSPAQYQQACRLRTLKRGLRDGDRITDAIYEAGFGSSSRVYEQAATRIGMTPGEYRAGGQGVDISWACCETPLGRLMMAATDRGLCSVKLGDDEADLLMQLRAEYPQAVVTAMPKTGQEPLRDWMNALTAYLEDGRQAPALPMDIRGTAFQMKVWEYLCRIPAGELRSYAEVAHAIGRSKAVRAVASACAANRVALVIPCHRVIRGDGGMGGYRWGVERKRALIESERVARASDRRELAAAKRK